MVVSPDKFHEEIAVAMRWILLRRFATIPGICIKFTRQTKIWVCDLTTSEVCSDVAVAVIPIHQSALFNILDSNLRPE